MLRHIVDQTHAKERAKDDTEGAKRGKNCQLFRLLSSELVNSVLTSTHSRARLVLSHSQQQPRRVFFDYLANGHKDFEQPTR